MSNIQAQDRGSDSLSAVKCVLTVIGVLAVGLLVFLLLGGIMSGIGVPMWISWVLAAVVLLPLAAVILLKWDKLYSACTSAGDAESLRLSKAEKPAYKAVKKVLGIPAAAQQAMTDLIARKLSLSKL